uniref:Conserved plasma membrane protein n=2 Tax=Caenorhabditis tropicalis TaxID=1561998 RepID=A0A1I7TT88_9PELO
MRIGNFSLKPKKEEEEPKALGYDFDDILEHFERDEIELDEKRKKFRAFPIYIQVVSLIIPFIFSVYFGFTQQLDHLHVVTFLVFFLFMHTNFLFFGWYDRLKKLHSSYYEFEVGSRVLYRLSIECGYTKVDWQEVFPVFRYRTCIMETCYVGMYLLYFIGHVIVSFLVFRQMEPLYYNSAIYQTYAAIVPVVLCSIAFKKSFKNLMKLRKANQRLSKLISHCYI